MSTPERTREELVRLLRHNSQGACGMFVAGSKGAVLCFQCGATRYRHTYREAADTIDALQQDVARLTAEREAERQRAESFKAEVFGMAADRDAHVREAEAYVQTMQEMADARIAEFDAQVREAEERAFMAGREDGERAGRIGDAYGADAAFAAYRAQRQPAPAAHPSHNIGGSGCTRCCNVEPRYLAMPCPDAPADVCSVCGAAYPMHDRRACTGTHGEVKP